MAQGPQVEVEASAFNTRIAFNPNESTVAWRFAVPGYRGLYCASAQAVFDFRTLLLTQMRTRDAAALRRVLDEVEKSSGREEQFRVLFGVALPPSSGLFQPPIYEGLSSSAYAQLQMGQEVTMSGLGAYRCLTPPQIDSVNAEARRVYQAVIAEMAGLAAKGTTQPPPSGTLQAPRTRQ